MPRARQGRWADAAGETGASEEEIAAALSAEEGRPVTVQQVRRIEQLAIRKVRRALADRGWAPESLLPESK